MSVHGGCGDHSGRMASKSEKGRERSSYCEFQHGSAFHLSRSEYTIFGFITFTTLQVIPHFGSHPSISTFTIHNNSLSLSLSLSLNIHMHTFFFLVIWVSRVFQTLRLFFRYVLSPFYTYQEIFFRYVLSPFYTYQEIIGMQIKFDIILYDVAQFNNFQLN